MAKKLSSKFLKVAAALEKQDAAFRSDKDSKGLKLWSVPRSTAEFLRFLVLVRKPKQILELGTSGGYSTMWIASAAEEYGGRVQTIEIAPLKIEMAEKNLKNAGIKNVKIIKGDLYNLLPAWKQKIDFLFIDANKKNYLTYLKHLEPHLRDNTMIVADNAGDFGDWMKDYLKYVSENKNYTSVFLEMDHGLMLSVYKPK